MKKTNFLKLFVASLMTMCSLSVAFAVDYSLGGYLNGADVNGYSNEWKFTLSGSNYELAKTFTTTDNYFWVFDSNGTKYGVSSYTENNPSTLVQNGGEKVGARGLSTSSVTTITFNPSTKQISWTSGGGSTGQLKEPYVISVYKDGWDEQYTFTPVSGSTNYEYEVMVEIPDYTGNPADYKYWVGEEGKWKDGQSDNYNLGSRNKADDDYLASCETGVFRAKIYALQENGQAHGEARNYYIHDMSCGEHGAKISLSSNIREFDKSEAPTSITLTATADDKSEGKYIWYKSDDEGATYTKITETTGNTYTLSGSEIPSGDRNYYKVTRKVVDSDDFISAICVIYTVQSCGDNTKGSNVFRETFGELTAVRGSGSRTSFDGIVDGYTYQPASYKINDGYYAVVAEPYYCGCGNGGDMSEQVTDDCLAKGVWFRQLRDHTLMNNGTTAPFGGMLMINFNGTGIAYQRILTDAEKASITKNSILKFSAYFASAAVKSKQDVTFNPINMELKIQFKETDTDTWTDAAVVRSEVNYDEGWQRSEVEWTVDDADGDFRLVINNNGATGDGNDLLIDDISLDLCTPSFALYFYDDDDNQFEELEASNVNESAPIRVKQVNFGSLGNDPCMQLYKRTIAGTDTTYYHVTDMTLSNGYYYAQPTLASLIDDVPGSAELVAVASVKAAGACDNGITKGVEDGTYTVGQQTNVIFSSNHLTYSIECGSSTLTNYEDVSKICQSTDTEAAKMPVLKLASNNISGVVTCDIYVNNQLLLEEVDYNEESTGCGYMLLDIDALYEAAKSTTYNWPVGTNTIKVKVKEKYVDATVCERWANGSVAIQVVKRPTITADLVADEICEGVGTTLSVTASPVTKYQWQVMEPGEDWTNVGTNSPSYATPTNIANETQYRVLLFNDNDLLCETTSGVAVMTVKQCDDMTLSQAVDNASACVGDPVTYTVTLTNNAAGSASNVAANIVWDGNLLKFEEASSTAFDQTTATWSVGEMTTKQATTLKLKFTVLASSDSPLELKSFVSSLNAGTCGDYDRQEDSMKGTSFVTIKAKADAPTPKRKGEDYAFNLCKGDVSYGNPIPYNFLIEDKMDDGSDFDKSNLVWMDKNYNVIDAANANFSVNTVQDVTLYVYNNPQGYCKSDTIKVAYRVKDNTSTPTVNDYIDCVDPEAEEVLLNTRVENASDYKYLVFSDEFGNEAKVFYPSNVGETTYKVIAYKDEFGTCPSEPVELNITVKDYADASVIVAEDVAICPNETATLSASSSISNAVYTWYDADGEYLATGAAYTTPALAEETTYLVTVSNEELCEAPAQDGKEVAVGLKTIITHVSLLPENGSVVIGGNEVKTLTIEPADAVYTAVWAANGKPVEVTVDGNVQTTQAKPYIDTQYVVEVIGECSADTLQATTTVVWPTVFTPYVLDGMNDTFVKNMTPNFHTVICNRFGMPLIESDNGWDGRLGDGKLAVPGVYYYVVTLPDGNVKKGTIEVFKK